MKKSKKSPKEKQKMSKTEPPPKKDPVQYVSETGEGDYGLSSYRCTAGQHDLRPMLGLIVPLASMMMMI